MWYSLKTELSEALTEAFCQRIHRAKYTVFTVHFTIILRHMHRYMYCYMEKTHKRNTHTRTLGYLGPRATCLPAWHSDTWDPFKAAVEPPTSTTSFPLQTRSQRLTPPRRHRDKGLRPVTLFPMWQNQSVTHCQKHCYKRQPVEAFMCHTVIVHGAQVQFSSTILRPWSHVQTSSSNTVWDTLMFSIC